jgi:ABC-type spermidine/putrescine transport system permease subunit II
MMRAYIALYVAFLFVPIGIIILFSFHASPALSFPFQGFSLRWYQDLFADKNFTDSIINSLKVGASTTVLTTVIGTFAALALARLRGQLKAMFGILNFAPIGLPGLFLGIALVVLFAQIGFQRSLVTVVIAHVLFTLPFFIEVMRARVEHFDLALEEAARDLGASPVQTFRMVTLPIIAPTIAGAALLVFALSFDEFIITVFASGNDTTLPLFIWSMMRRAADPSINAASVLALGISLAVLAGGGAILWQQRRKALASRAPDPTTDLTPVPAEALS